MFIRVGKRLRKRDGMHLNLTIEDLIIPCLVDTCADMSVIILDLLHNLPQEERLLLKKVEDIITLADGKTVPLHGLVKVRIQMEGISLEHEFLVADIDVDCMFGLYFLE